VVTASYYREQARVFAVWALAATNPEVAKRLRTRADEYIALAEQLEAMPPQAERRAESASAPQQQQQQQQQIQPMSDEGG
jgi:nucleoid-associated protein YgaU